MLLLLLLLLLLLIIIFSWVQEDSKFQISCPPTSISKGDKDKGRGIKSLYVKLFYQETNAFTKGSTHPPLNTLTAVEAGDMHIWEDKLHLFNNEQF